jgi:uncharacterized membrane protein
MVALGMASVEETSAGAPAQKASLVPTGLIFGAFLVFAIIFAISAGSWYSTFMAVHVLFVVIWIGGGMLLTIFGIMAERSNDPSQVAQIAKMASFAGEKIFAPAGLIVVAMGISMVLNAHLGFGHFWIIFGLIGFLTTFLIGIGVLAPRAKKLNELVQEKGPTAPETQAAISSILLIARADMAMLLLVIVDMVTKPFS